VIQLLPYDEMGSSRLSLVRRPASWSTAERALLVAIMLCGAALRFSTLDLQSFDLDESVTVALLHHGFGGMLSSIPHTESTPPLYYVVAWAWTRVFGLSEVGLRSLSALLGTLMIAGAYFATRRLASRRAALIAAALTAVSPWLIWYSQEARAYALFALFALGSFVLFLRALDDPRGRSLAAWGALSALALASHYFALFLVVPEAAWLLTQRGSRRGAVIASGLLAAVGLALLPLALEQAHDIRAKAGFLQTALSSRITSIPTRFLLGESPPAGGKLLLVAITAVLAGVGALLLLPRSDGEGHGPRVGRALWVGGLAVMVPLVLALAGRDYLDARNLIGAWVPLAVVVAAGLGSAPRIGTLAAVGLVLAFAGVAIAGDLDSAAQRADYRGVVGALGPSPGPGERTLVVTPEYNWTPLAFYLPGYPSLPAGNVGVREIDLIGWRSATLGRGTARSLYRRGFRLTQNRAVQKLRLVRFVAAHPVSISREGLVAARLGSSGATVLIQRSG
jgi:mannosyltransferase